MKFDEIFMRIHLKNIIFYQHMFLMELELLRTNKHLLLTNQGIHQKRCSCFYIIDCF